MVKWQLVSSLEVLGLGFKGLGFRVDPLLINPFPLTGIVIGIIILRPLEGGDSLIRGSTLGLGTLPTEFCRTLGMGLT